MYKCYFNLQFWLFFLVSSLTASGSFANEDLHPVSNSIRGNVALVRPEGFPKEMDACLYVHPKNGGQKPWQICLNKALTLAPGRYSLKTTSWFEGINVSNIGMDIEVTPNERLEIQISVVYADLPLGIKAKVFYSNARLDHAWFMREAEEVTQKPFVVALPGKDSIYAGKRIYLGNDFDRFLITPPATSKSVFNITDQLMKVHFELDAPTQEVFTDGQELTWRLPSITDLSLRKLAGNSLQVHAAVPFKQILNDGSIFYSFYGPCLHLSENFNCSDRVTQPGEFIYHLKRLNVEHLKTEDGRIIEGRYIVYNERGDKIATGINLRTGTGLDLPVGKYRIEVQGNDPESGEVYFSVNQVEL